MYSFVWFNFLAEENGSPKELVDISYTAALDPKNNKFVQKQILRN